MAHILLQLRQIGRIFYMVCYIHYSDWVRKSSVPWASFTVHGFIDSPVSWSEIEHGYHTNGDNLYTIIVFSDTKYWLYTATGSCDIVS